MGGYLSPAYNYNAIPYGGVPNYGYSMPQMTNPYGAAMGQGSPYGLQGYPTAQNPMPQMGGSNVLNQMYGNRRSQVDPMFGYLGAASAGTLRTILGLTTTDAMPLSLHSFVADTLPPLLSLGKYGISAFALQHFFDPTRGSNFPSRPTNSYNPLVPTYNQYSGSGYGGGGYGGGYGFA